MEEIKKELQNLITKIKEEIAIANDYTLETPTKWDYAMKITHRTKRQLELYDMVFDGLIFHLVPLISSSYQRGLKDAIEVIDTAIKHEGTRWKEGSPEYSLATQDYRFIKSEIQSKLKESEIK